MNMRTYMTAGEAAEYMRLSPSTLYRLVAAKRVATIRVGRALRFWQEDLDQFMHGHRQDTLYASVNLQARQIEARRIYGQHLG